MLLLGILTAVQQAQSCMRAREGARSSRPHVQL